MISQSFTSSWNGVTAASPSAPSHPGTAPRTPRSCHPPVTQASLSSRLPAVAKSQVPASPAAPKHSTAGHGAQGDLRAGGMRTPGTRAAGWGQQEEEEEDRRRAMLPHAPSTCGHQSGEKRSLTPEATNQQNPLKILCVKQAWVEKE